MGKVSCGAFSESYSSCKESNLATKELNPCMELKLLASRCYSAKDSAEVNDYIMGEFEEGLMMLRFLQSRKSSIPEKLGSNSWAVFTNPANLELYEKVRPKRRSGEGRG